MLICAIGAGEVRAEADMVVVSEVCEVGAYVPFVGDSSDLMPAIQERKALTE